MASVKARPYAPDVAIPPGATILEMLAEKGITQAGFAERMKRPANKINELIHGKHAISVDTAMDLELVLGLPANFWLELDRNYQLAFKRIEAAENLQDQVETLKRFPIKEMIKLGWVEKSADTVEQTRKVL